MTYFKPRFKRDDAGGYIATYGKGKRKIEGRLFPDNGAWLILDDPSGSEYAKLRDAKEAWGRWAASRYNGEQSDSPDEGERDGGPTLPPPPMPSSAPPMPSAKPSGHVQRTCPENSFVADPFEGKFYDENADLTDVGALAEVWSWCESHIDILDPGHPWLSVRERLAAHFPDEVRFKQPRKVPR